jgi:glutamate carboxypeptidase
MIPNDLPKMFLSGVPRMLDELRQLVELETPSEDRTALDRLKPILVDRLRGLSAQVTAEDRHSGSGHVVARFDGPSGRAPALIVGHYDTVWPVGTLEKMPFRVEHGKAFGPGIFDMKASFTIFARVMEWIRAAALPLERPVWALFTCDEEVGSPSSRALIEELAQQAAYVLVLEPALPDGGLKTSRKGVGRFHLEVTGKAAHAGVAPREGRSSIVELAHQILKLQTLQDLEAGSTINIGVVRGGTAPNVVPALASATIDVRVSTMDEAARIESAIRSLTPFTPDTRVAVTGDFNRPPMERAPKIISLFEQAQRIGRRIGLELSEGSTGGGSDGNFTAALGVPTLDGLGARGAGAHADHEHIVIDSLSERAALLAALLLELRME